MAKGHKFRTLDAVYKLGSYPVPQNGRTVPTMDRITTQELKGAIFEDNHDSSRTRVLGFLLDTIFAEFSVTIPSPESLTVRRHIIQKFSPSIASSYPNDTENIPLYNANGRSWNWPLPAPRDTSPEQTTQAASGGKLEGGWQENLVAAFFNAVSTALEPSVREHHDTVPTAPEPEIRQDGHVPQGQKRGMPHRHWLAKHSNRRLPGAVNGAGAYDRRPDLVLLESAEYATESISWLSPTVLGEYTTEAWRSNMRLVKTLHTKAYLTFLDQPWRRFVLCLSICRGELRLHLYDRSGVCISPPFNIYQRPTDFLTILAAVVFAPRLCIGFDPTVTVFLTRPLRIARRKVIQTPTGVPSTIHENEVDEQDEKVGCRDADIPQASSSRACDVDIIGGMFNEPGCVLSGESAPPYSARIGRIRVNDNWYDILDVLFSSSGFLGRGTIIYLASRNGETYVIKDHWVENTRNEVTMMNRVEGIPGVPEVVEYWQVEVAEGIVDRTSRYRPEKQQKYMKGDRIHVRIVMRPCGRPLTQFKTKHELIQSVRDVLVVQSDAVQRGILHRDTSPSNILIRDLPDRTSGMLIDWEFAVEITVTNRYSVGGTGTIPFLSRSLLGQILDGLKVRTVHTQHGVYEENHMTSMSLTSSPAQGDFTLIHKPKDDIESLFYVLLWIAILYNGPGGQEREHFDFETSILSQWTESSISNLDAAKNSKTSLITEHRDQLKLASHVSLYFCDLVPLLEDWREIFRAAQYHGHAVDAQTCLNVLDSHLARIPSRDTDSSIRLVRKENLEILKESLPKNAPLKPAYNTRKRIQDIWSMGDAPLPVKRSRDTAL